MPNSAGRRAAALLTASSLLWGCIPASQRFEAIGSDWTAEITDMTGRIVAVQAETGPVGYELRSDAVQIRNIGPQTIEVAWRGEPDLEAVWFTVRQTRAGIDLRYQLGVPCDSARATAYAFTVQFDAPVRAEDLRASPVEP